MLAHTMKPTLAILTLVAVCVSGCLASASKINAVKLGMPKAEVEKVMGKPASVTMDDAGEHMNYMLAETATTYGNPGTPYEVLLVDGKVKSFGRVGTVPGKRAPMIQPVILPK